MWCQPAEQTRLEAIRISPGLKSGAPTAKAKPAPRAGRGPQWRQLVRRISASGL